MKSLFCKLCGVSRRRDVRWRGAASSVSSRSISDAGVPTTWRRRPFVHPTVRQLRLQARRWRCGIASKIYLFPHRSSHFRFISPLRQHCSGVVVPLTTTPVWSRHDSETETAPTYHASTSNVIVKFLLQKSKNNIETFSLSSIIYIRNERSKTVVKSILYVSPLSASIFLLIDLLAMRLSCSTSNRLVWGVRRTRAFFHFNSSPSTSGIITRNTAKFIPEKTGGKNLYILNSGRFEPYKIALLALS